MYDEQLFDQWANAYDEDVKRTDEAGAYPFAGHERILGTIADRILESGAQDVLDLGSEARTNTPGTVGGNNWKWRLKPGELTDKHAIQLKDMNVFFGRNLEGKQ